MYVEGILLREDAQCEFTVKVVILLIHETVLSMCSIFKSLWLARNVLYTCSGARPGRFQGFLETCQILVITHIIIEVVHDEYN